MTEKNYIYMHKLSKSFGKQTVLHSVNLTVKPGEIIGLIGPSGAGKSTAIKVLLGMEKGDGGQALVLGTKMPNREILGRIGYMAQSDALYENLSAQENLIFFGKMRGIKTAALQAEIEYVAQVVDLTNHLSKRVSGYSGGMKRRLSLAIAMLGRPELMILDEPTVGIDPALRRNIWVELAKIRDEGRSILVTTHVMDEAELTDRVALLLHGGIIAFDTPQKLERQYQVKSIEEVFLKAEEEK